MRKDDSAGSQGESFAEPNRAIYFGSALCRGSKPRSTSMGGRRGERTTIGSQVPPARYRLPGGLRPRASSRIGHPRSREISAWSARAAHRLAIRYRPTVPAGFHLLLVPPISSEASTANAQLATHATGGAKTCPRVVSGRNPGRRVPRREAGERATTCRRAGYCLSRECAGDSICGHWPPESQHSRGFQDQLGAGFPHCRFDPLGHRWWNLGIQSTRRSSWRSKP